MQAGWLVGRLFRSFVRSFFQSNAGGAELKVDHSQYVAEETSRTKIRLCLVFVDNFNCWVFTVKHTHPMLVDWMWRQQRQTSSL